MSLKSNGKTLDRQVVLSTESSQEDEEPNPDSYLTTAYVGYFDRSGNRANSPIMDQATFVSPKEEWGPDGPFARKETKAEKEALANLRAALKLEGFTRAEIRTAFENVIREYP